MFAHGAYDRGMRPRPRVLIQSAIDLYGEDEVIEGAMLFLSGLDHGDALDIRFAWWLPVVGTLLVSRVGRSGLPLRLERGGGRGRGRRPRRRALAGEGDVRESLSAPGTDSRISSPG